MKIIEKKINELIPYENNPRINDGAVEFVANSIKEFGFKVPIIVDGNGVIVAGHTRFKAAKRLGLVSVPCIVASDLNDDQIKAFRLADNKTSEFAQWDFSALDDELESIDMDMSDFGFFESDNFDPAETEISETEYKERETETVRCPNCGMEFEP